MAPVEVAACAGSTFFALVSLVKGEFEVPQYGRMLKICWLHKTLLLTFSGQGLCKG